MFNLIGSNVPSLNHKIVPTDIYIISTKNSEYYQSFSLNNPIKSHRNITRPSSRMYPYCYCPYRLSKIVSHMSIFITIPSVSLPSININPFPSIQSITHLIRCNPLMRIRSSLSLNTNPFLR